MRSMHRTTGHTTNDVSFVTAVDLLRRPGSRRLLDTARIIPMTPYECYERPVRSARGQPPADCASPAVCGGSARRPRRVTHNPGR